MDGRRIVVNSDWGGFRLSDEAIEHYGRLAGLNLIRVADADLDGVTHWYVDVEDDDHHLSHYNLPRDCPHLVRTVEELGVRANGFSASLAIVEIPGDVEWEICEYDGVEWVAERHRRWYPT